MRDRGTEEQKSTTDKPQSWRWTSRTNLHLGLALPKSSPESMSLSSTANSPLQEEKLETPFLGSSAFPASWGSSHHKEPLLRFFKEYLLRLYQELFVSMSQISISRHSKKAGSFRGSWLKLPWTPSCLSVLSTLSFTTFFCPSRLTSLISLSLLLGWYLQQRWRCYRPSPKSIGNVNRVWSYGCMV